MAAPVFKLPEAFLARHKDVLDTWDWARWPEMPLNAAVPNAGFTDDDKLEAIGRGASLIVRSKHPGTMKRMRAYAETLPGHRDPTPEEIAAVLKARNPETPE